MQLEQVLAGLASATTDSVVAAASAPASVKAVALAADTLAASAPGPASSTSALVAAASASSASALVADALVATSSWPSLLEQSLSYGLRCSEEREVRCLLAAARHCKDSHRASCPMASSYAKVKLKIMQGKSIELTY